jgi:glycosyltransferase involved in cell wall biosynthesis
MTVPTKAIHVVHLSTYPANDIRVFQKACKSEVAEGYAVTQIVCGARTTAIDGVEILSLPAAAGRLSRMISLSWKMYLAAKHQNADIYQFHHPDLIPAGLLLKLCGKKVIYEPREYFPDKILSMRWIPQWLRPAASALFRTYERITSLMWDHIIVADRYSAKAFSGRPVSVVPNYPLLTPVADPSTNDRELRKLIYVGGLSDERGLDVMLKIAELLRSHNVTLELMGSFAFRGDKDRLSNYPNVRYLGNQDLQSVYSRLTQADLGLLLLQPVPAYTYAGENTLKLFEYMWCGLPVVSSDFPNLRDIIDRANCGICINPSDADRAAEAILNLLDNEALRREMTRNGREAVVEAYNWPAASKVMMQVYRNVLSGVTSNVGPLPLWNSAAFEQGSASKA